MIPLKLVEIAAHVLYSPYAKANYNRLLQGANNIFDTDQEMELIKQPF